VDGDGFIWANLIHLSYNMWGDRFAPDRQAIYVHPKQYLRCDDTLWDDIVQTTADAGMNMVIIDLGDGVQYESHPEISLCDAWSKDRLRRELVKMRELGLEPIPKLNFSAGHDPWLGEYSRMVSTSTYYAVCRDLIAEVIELFDTPRFFHLGMDEETAPIQRYNNLVIVRQYELWWHDMYFLFDEVERGGSRPWVWADYARHHPEDFVKNMPKSAVQSNWYHRADFSRDNPDVMAYHLLDEHGYDQIPAASNYRMPGNFQMTVDYFAEHFDPKHLLGIQMNVWQPTLEECRPRYEHGIEAVKQTLASLKQG